MLIIRAQYEVNTRQRSYKVTNLRLVISLFRNFVISQIRTSHFTLIRRINVQFKLCFAVQRITVKLGEPCPCKFELSA